MKKFALISLAFVLPVIAFAQDATQKIGSIQQLIKFGIDFINNILVPLVFALSFFIFIFGVFRYFVAGAADQEARKKGLDVMIYGIVGIAAMLSVYGLVNLLTGSITLTGQSGVIQQYPQVPGTR
jgi:hypothetical protein